MPDMNNNLIVLLTAKLVDSAQKAIQDQLDKWNFHIKIKDSNIDNSIKEDIQDNLDNLSGYIINIDDVTFDKDFVKKVQQKLDTFNGLSINIDTGNFTTDFIRNIQSQLDNIRFSLNFDTGNFPKGGGGNQPPRNPNNPNPPRNNNVTDVIPSNVRDTWDEVTSPKIEVDYEVREGASEDLNAAIRKEIERIQDSDATVISYRYNTRAENTPVENPVSGEIYLEKVEKITGATLKYTTATGEAITKTLRWGQVLDEETKAVVFEGWTSEITAYSNEVQQATEKTDSLVAQQTKRMADLRNQVSQIYQSAIDPNASKSITDQSHLDELERRYNEITAEIAQIGSTSKTEFEQQAAHVTALITELKNLKAQYKNMENISTSLKADKLEEAASKAESQFASLQAKITQAGVSSQKLTDNITIIQDALNRRANGQLLNKPELEAVATAITNARNELTALINIKATNSALEKVKLDAQSVVNELDEMSKKNPTFDSWEHELNGVKITVADLKQELSGITNTADLSVAKAKVNEFKSAFKASVETVKVSANELKNVQEKLNDGTFESQYETMRKKALSYVNANGQAIVSTEKLDSAYKALIAADTPDKQIKAAKDFAEAYKATNNVIKTTTTSLDKVVSEQQRLAKANAIEAWNQKNSRATAEVRQKNEEYIKSLRDLNTQMSRMKFNEINNGFKQSENSMRAINRLGASLSDQLKQAAESFSQWISVSGAIMYAVDKTKEAVSELKELDNILTEISKTSDLTKNELKELGSESFQLASKFGKKASDYLSGVTEMSRSGFYGAQGSAMAEQSLLAQAAGDMGNEIANKYVIATNAAYKFNGEAKKLNAVLDGQNAISNKNSIALEDFALAMSEAGTVAANYRVSIEDLSAMTGVIEAVTKSGGSEVGNSIKSILINLQNVNSAKIVKTLNKANASMTEFVDGTEQLRDPITILRDLAKTFNSLDEADPLRAEILTNVAGKYQAPKLSALLSNMELFDKMLKDYAGGQGSALEEATKSANNWSGSLNKLSNQWSETISYLADSDSIVNLINLLTDLLSITTQITETIGFTGFAGLVGGAIATKQGMGKMIVYNASFYKVV